MRFDAYNFDAAIKKNIQLLGYKKPTDIQFKAIPPILKGDDVLAIAQTGTGKTAAFAIPVINMLHENKLAGHDYGIRCLVMVPTHELAIQEEAVFNSLAQNTYVSIFSIHGGVDQAPQIERLQQSPDIIISTPGRFFDLVSQGHLKTKNIEILILDEADHMLDLGFINDIRQLVDWLPRNRQTLFFSATINTTIKELAYSLVSKPVRIQISPKDPVAKNIDHSVAHIAMDDKRFFLERLINENPESKILVFVRTKVRAERVVKAMERAMIKSISLHSDKDQQERNLAMKQFREGEVKVLVATDISARGIDIPDVDYVVNYDLPENEENYVHRVGRTGRGTKKGQAFSFCSPEELEILEDIETFLDKPIKVVDISKSAYSATIEFASDDKDDWRSLLKEEESEVKWVKKKRKK
ncbi:MAG: DEAD/DEAH box helicase, partial [Bacteroidota bacterium]